MSKIKSGILKLNTALIYSGAVLMMVSVVLATVNALARKFLSTSFAWAEELCMYSVVMGFFMSIPYLELKRKQLSVDVIRSVIHNETVHKVMYLLYGVVEIALFIILIRFGIISTQAAIVSGVTTNYMHIPKYILYIVVIATFVCSLLSWVAILLNKGESYK